MAQFHICLYIVFNITWKKYKEVVVMVAFTSDSNVIELLNFKS